ncbi:MAG: hypothetical protein OJJ54_05280 [Pseudonocardia sp.]|nr:hypothetical protein [Pseudonocardia sp.]
MDADLPGGDILFRMLLSPTALAVIGGVLLVLVLVLAFVLRRMWRRARSFADSQSQRIDRARTEFAALRLPAGPQRRAVDLRRRLATAVSATERQFAPAAEHALVSATVQDQYLELRRLAAGLDTHLRSLQDDPDAGRVEASLPEATAWTGQLCDVAAELRAAVRETTSTTTDTDVRALGASTIDGVAALRAGMDFLRGPR